MKSMIFLSNKLDTLNFTPRKVCYPLYAKKYWGFLDEILPLLALVQLLLFLGFYARPRTA